MQSRAHTSGLRREIRKAGKVLGDLHRSLRRLVPLLTAAMKNGAAGGQARHRPRLSAKVRRSLVLQGRYMGYVRQLKPKQKAQVRKIREATGSLP